MSPIRTARAIVYVRALRSLGHFKRSGGHLLFCPCGQNLRPLPNGLPEPAQEVPVSDWIDSHRPEIAKMMFC